MNKSNALRAALVALLISGPTLYAQQQDIPHSQIAHKQTKAPKKFWTRTKMIFAGIAGAAAIAFAGLGIKNQLKAMNTSDIQYKQELDQLDSLEQVKILQSKPQWKQIAESEHGKEISEEWLHHKLALLQKDLDALAPSTQIPFEKFPFRIEYEIDKPDFQGQTALMYAVYRELPAEIIKRMIDLGADVTKSDPRNKNKTPIIVNQELVEYLEREVKKPNLQLKERNRAEQDLANNKAINDLLQKAVAAKAK